MSRVLSAAPRIAILADGNQGIAFDYLNAAAIKDELGNAWTNNSPGVLTPLEVAGTNTNHKDGALFRPSGQPAYCELMTMHWNVNATEVPEVAAELASFLTFPVHVNAECQAVNALEGEPPVGGRAKFVSTAGFTWPAPNRPNAVEFSNSALPFAQMDGPFDTVGGSEPAYALASGSTYYDSGIVMVRALGQPRGVQDIWMTGYPFGLCPIEQETCAPDGNAVGKVSYLGGHRYDVATPISSHGTTQGTRLFLNSLYEAGCVTTDGQPQVNLNKAAPTTTANPTLVYTLNYSNDGSGPALQAVLTDTLPAGTTFVSATGGGTFNNGVVTWNLGDLAAHSSGVVTLTVTLSSPGLYSNTARVSFQVGQNLQETVSSPAQTQYGSCNQDSQCGGAQSGMVCNQGSCISGCRGTSGNGCAPPAVCTSANSNVGQCVIPDGGGNASSVGSASSTGSSGGASASGGAGSSRASSGSNSGGSGAGSTSRSGSSGNAGSSGSPASSSASGGGGSSGTNASGSAGSAGSGGGAGVSQGTSGVAMQDGGGAGTEPDAGDSGVVPAGGCACDASTGQDGRLGFAAVLGGLVVMLQRGRTKRDARRASRNG